MLRLIATVALVFIFVISIAAQDRASFDTAEAGHAGTVETDDLNASSSGFLGVRGMGEVYLARDTQLDRSIAIKRFPHTLRDQQTTARAAALEFA